MAVSKDYTRFVYRVWDRLEQRTGHVPAYLDASHIGSRCPACLHGTVRIGFVKYPEPSLVVETTMVLDEPMRWLLTCGGLDPLPSGGCTHGCTEAQIGEALFS